MAAGAVADRRIVSHDQERDALAIELLEDLHDLVARARVEVARRLVGEQKTRLHDDCAPDRDALPLTARELVRAVRKARLEAHRLQDRGGAFAPRARRGARQHERQLDVLERRQARNQMEELEDEADVPLPVCGELVVVEIRDVLALQSVGARRRAVEQAEHVQQRGLSRARRAHDRDVLACVDLEIDVVERVHDLFADDVLSADSGELHHGAATPPRGYSGVTAAPSTTPSRSMELTTRSPFSMPRRISVNSQFEMPVSTVRDAIVPVASS